MHVLADLLYGILIGFALGLTGGGGSIITLPVLVYLIGEPVHQAIGTSLAIVGGIAAQGFIAQRTRVRFATGLLVGLLGVVGAVPGSLLAAHVSGRTLLLLFAAIMGVAASSMLFVRLPQQHETRAALWLPVAFVGVGLGFLTGFLGVGGGFLIVPALVFALGVPMKEAIATSLLVIFLNMAVALLARVGSLEIDWVLTALFVLGGLAGNFAGSLLTVRLDQRRLKTVFAVFVLAVGAFTASSALDVIPVRLK